MNAWLHECMAVGMELSQSHAKSRVYITIQRAGVYGSPYNQKSLRRAIQLHELRVYVKKSTGVGSCAFFGGRSASQPGSISFNIFCAKLCVIELISSLISFLSLALCLRESSSMSFS